MLRFQTIDGSKLTLREMLGLLCDLDAPRIVFSSKRESAKELVKIYSCRVSVNILKVLRNLCYEYDLNAHEVYILLCGINYVFLGGRSKDNHFIYHPRTKATTKAVNNLEKLGLLYNVNGLSTYRLCSDLEKVAMKFQPECG